jgi:nicotinamide-nucleotide amidase
MSGAGAVGAAGGAGSLGSVSCTGAVSGPGAAAGEVLGLLGARGWTLAVAESLTGGLVAAELAAVPGASRVFRGAVIAYATDLKHRLLGVDAELLAAKGAVDPQVAREMAEGIRDRLGADWGASTTGVAGPDPQDGQPVGTVFVAVAGPSRTEIAALRLTGDRTAIRAASVTAVLELLDAELRRSTVAGPDFGMTAEVRTKALRGQDNASEQESGGEG